MKIRIDFEAEILNGATHDEIYDWLRFTLGTNGTLSGKNPLIKQSLEALPYTIGFDVEDYEDDD